MFGLILFACNRFTPDHSARVIGTTPKFSTEIYAPTSLYDLMEDIYETEARKDPNYKLNVEWYRDIWPLLQRPSLLSWVNGQANNGHGASVNWARSAPSQTR